MLMPGGTLHIALVHELPFYMDGIRQALRQGQALMVALTVRTCTALLDALRGGAELDMVFVELDPARPEDYGLVKRLLQRYAALPVIGLLRDRRPHAVRRALACGLRAVLPANVEGPELLCCVEAVRITKHYVNDLFRKQLDHTGRLLPDPDAPPEKIKAKFTPAELRFIRIACGPGRPTYPKVAKRMKKSPAYIEDLRKSVYAKLGMRKNQRRPQFQSLVELWGLAKD